ncbi:MAG: glycosyl transferase family 2 [uncultured bacterium]|uniref:Glycosyl transferase family 2 n=1 Tax=Berkelbacteria bacterium GW2011_GWA2_35_9 TaxID=1618333 RepID=A0A0G0DJL0_9BACT|nr:MAG: glycosyl transferase family 2 [uncultured bacterium]KKP88976.1 MAG: Glycosyl transferase family 2 [Berkelbacteria bacterium GW2011_GWA2_35_9]
MNKITVLIFAKNETITFKRVLEHASNPKFCDQLLVVLDEGFLPEIKDLAQEFQADIVIKKLQNFRDHKNFGIAQAKNNWVLLLDADEIVDGQLTDALEKFRQNDKVLDFGYNIKFKTYFFNHWLRYGGTYPDLHIRLFDKRKAKYRHTIHELLFVDGKIGEIDGHIEHYSVTYFSQWLKKIPLYTDLEANFLIKKGRQFSLTYLIGKPLKEFFWRFVQLKGYRDGFHGLRFALMASYYRFRTALKIKKLDSRCRNASLPARE